MFPIVHKYEHHFEKQMTQKLYEQFRKFTVSNTRTVNITRTKIEIMSIV